MRSRRTPNCSVAARRRAVVPIVAWMIAASAGPVRAAQTFEGFNHQDVNIFPVQIPFTLPTGGELIESRLTLNIDWLQGADPSTLVMHFAILVQDSGGDPEIAETLFLPISHFAFDGLTMTGTFAPPELVGPLYTDELGQANGSLTLINFGGFGFWGVGDLQAEFDVIVPEPATAGLVVLAAAGGLLRRGSRGSHRVPSERHQ